MSGWRRHLFIKELKDEEGFPCCWPLAVGRWPLAVGRWPLCATLIAGGLLICFPQAHAAHWEMTYSPDGMNTPGDSGTGDKWFDEYEWEFIDMLEPGAVPPGRYRAENNEVYVYKFTEHEASYISSSNVLTAVSASSSGSVTVFLKWVQDTNDNPPQPAPKLVLLKIWGLVGATAIASSNASSTVESKFGNKSKAETMDDTNADVMGIYKESSFNVSENDAVTIPLSVSEGESEVEYTFSLKAKASTPEFSPTPNFYTGSKVDAGVRFHALPITTGVVITSDIETSWKKFTGAASSLPDAYKKRNAAGTLIDEPREDRAVLVAPHFFDPSKHIWKIACLRAADGTMEVESAAEHMRDGSWITIGSLFGNAVGYSPEIIYDWNLGGSHTRFSTGVASGSHPVDLDKPSVSLATASSAYRSGIIVGSGTAGNLSPTTTTLQVTEGAVHLPSIQDSDSYKINWHRTYENPEKTGMKANADHNLFSPDTFDNTEVAYQNGTLTTYEFRVGRLAWVGDVAEGAASAFELLSAVSFENPALSTILAAIGLGLSEIDPVEELVTAVPNYRPQWNEAVRLGLIPNGATVNNWDDCKMVYPYISVWYDEHYYMGDAYEPHGFAGRKPKAKKVRRQNDAVIYTGRYEWTSTRPLEEE